MEFCGRICYNVAIQEDRGTTGMLYYTNYPSPLGEILLLATEEALAGVWLPGQAVDQKLLAQAQRWDQAPMLVAGCAWLERYFHGACPVPQELPLAPQGTPFRQRVWKRLCEIPYGQLVTYGQLAGEIAKADGHKMSAQAVGGAVGHNPISIIIPCHRVIGANGSLVGYGGGLALKKRLLEYEGIDIRTLYDP